MIYFVYILRSNDNSLYIGQTNNLKRRLNQHIQCQVKGAKYTKEHQGFRLVYKEVFNNRLESMKREKQLKGWSRVKKEALISGNLTLLKKL